MMRQQRMMPEASDNGSQPYRNAFRCFEMAGMRCNKNNSLPLGRRHGLLVPLTWAALVPYLKARFYVRCPSYQPFRRTHRHGCMAGYHCLMPKGIIFVATHDQSVYISTLQHHSRYFNISYCKIYRLLIFPITIHSQSIGILSKKGAERTLLHAPLSIICDKSDA